MKNLKISTDFAKTIETLSDAEKGRLFTAMLNYAKTGQEPNLTGSERFVWNIAKSDIDVQFVKYNNRLASLDNANKYNPNHNGNPMEMDGKPLETEWKSNGNPMEEKGEEKENEREDAPIRKKEPKKEYTLEEKAREKEAPKRNPLSSPQELPDIESMFGYNQFLLNAVNDWLQYKKERRETYKPAGLKIFLSTVRNNVASFGEDAVIEVMTESMAANYQGVTWDRLKKRMRTGKKPLSFADFV